MSDVKIAIHTSPEAILDTFRELPDETKQTILTAFTFDEILARIGQRLKHETDWDNWDTSGWIDSARLRAEIIKIQGLEPEFRKDLESRIRSLENDVAHYKDTTTGTGRYIASPPTATITTQSINGLNE